MRYTLDISLRGKKAICQNCRRQFILDDDLLTDDEEPIPASYLSEETSIRSSDFISESKSDPSDQFPDSNKMDSFSSKVSSIDLNGDNNNRFAISEKKTKSYSLNDSDTSQLSQTATVFRSSASEETRQQINDQLSNCEFELETVSNEAELVPEEIEDNNIGPLENEKVVADIPTYPIEFRYDLSDRTILSGQNTTLLSEDNSISYAPDLEKTELGLEKSHSFQILIDSTDSLDFKTTQKVSFDEDSTADSSLRIWKVGDILLDGIYEVLPLNSTQIYAEGGVGVVHRVRHREWDIDLAVKSPKPGSIQTEAGKQNFERECQTWIELGLHTNIVTCYLVRRIDGIPRLFTELVTDGTLRDWIQDGRLYEGGKEVALERILDIAIQIAWGLEYAHQQGVLHLDVKPSNMMMSGTTAKVTDFGLAKVVSSLDKTGLTTDSCEGMTPSYCSPEQYEAFLLFQKLKMETNVSSRSSVIKNLIPAKKKQEDIQPKDSSLKDSHLKETHLNSLTNDNLDSELRRKNALSSKNGDLAKNSFNLSDSLSEENQNRSQKSSEPIDFAPLDLNSKNSEQFNSIQKTLSTAELISKIKITRQSDIWSWAISVLAMFHGRSPCKKGGQTAAEVFEVFLKMTPSKDRPALPLDMIGIMRTCFRRNPEERPASMQIIADRMIRIYQNVTGRPYPRKQPVNTAFTAESLCNRAASMLDLNKPDEAFDLLNKASEITHWHPQILFNKTLMLWRYGKISDIDALHQIEELTKYKNLDASSFYALGLLERERANPKAALEAFHRANELDLKRTDIIKARNITQNLVQKSARCIGRYISWLDNNQVTPLTYIDVNFDYCVIPTSDNRYSIFETESGLVRMNFKGTNHQKSVSSELLSDSKGMPAPFALSEDYRWELYPETAQTIILKDGQHIDQLYGQRFIKMEWGQNQVWNNLIRQISLTIRDHVVDVIDLKTKTLLRTFSGHEQSITSLAMSLDGKWAVTGSFDASLKIWEIDTGRCIRTFTGLSSAIQAVWIDPQHRFILSLIQGGTIQLWNIDLLCNEIQKTKAPIQICLIHSSEEVAQRQFDLDVLIADAKKAVNRNHYAEAIQLIQQAKKIDGWAAVRSDLNMSEWIGRHAYRKSLEEVVSTATFQGHDELISTVELSYDGNLGLTAGRDQVIRLWAFPKRQCLQELNGHFDWIRSVDMTLDARFAVSGSWDQTVRIWNLSNGNQIRNLKEPIRNITVVRFAPDGRTIGVATGTGEISLWDGASGDLINRWTAHDGYVNTFRFSRDGRYIISGGNRMIHIWNAKTKVPVRTISFHQADIVSAALSVDLRWLVSGDSNGKICLFDILNDNDQPIQTFEGHLASITSLELLPDNKWIVSAAKDKTVRIWSITEGKLLQTLEGNSGNITDLAIDLSGTTIFTGSEDAIIRRWSIYWNYDFPGRKHLAEETERMLCCLIGHYFRLMMISKLKMTPFHYYGSRSSDAFANLNVSDIFLDEKLIQRILTEMEYRGYGMISAEELIEMIRKICLQWNGFLLL